MLDINFIKNNIETIKKTIKDKGIKLNIDLLLKLDEKRRNLQKNIDNKRHQQKVAQNKKNIKEATKIKEEIKKLEKELDNIEKDYKNLMLLVPNIYSPDTPVGEDEKQNKEILRWGGIPKFNFKIKNHIEIGKELDLIDLESGAKSSGFRGYYLKNELVLVHFALLWHAILKLYQKGFLLMLPPVILKEFALIGSGHFPFGKEDIYQIANPGKLGDGKEIKDSLYLAGTSEPSVLAYFADKILDEKELPIKIGAISPCFRSEVGSYGKDTKGLYRIHEFWKVEQVVLCQDSVEISNRILEELKDNACEILKELNLPFRVIQICTGDMGPGKYKMYDIETWMPSRNSFGETHSDSNLTDWQARRLNIKYRTKDGKKKFVFTLNNTMLASPRILIAILENYQREDGSILIPEVIQKYLPFKEIKRK
ncbi:MAG: serine--tRNA ligase [Minisyncoccia bacterium]